MSPHLNAMFTKYLIPNPLEEGICELSNAIRETLSRLFYYLGIDINVQYMKCV